MPSGAINAGFARVVSLLGKMVEAAEAGDKRAVVTLSERFAEDAAGMTMLVAAQAGVTKEDLQKFSDDGSQDDALVKQAAEIPAMPKQG